MMYIYVFVSIDAEPVIYMVKGYNDVHAIGKLREHLETKHNATLREAGQLVIFDFPDGNVESYHVYKVFWKDLKGLVRL